jgi:uncharacterized protein YycO
MKISIILVLLPLTFGYGWAQKAAEATEKSPLGIDGKCLVVELEGQQKNVEAVMEAKFKKLKGSKAKGYEAFKAQVFPEISSNILDIYYKVETKKEIQSKVILFLSTGYDNWLNPQDHASEINNAKKMLESLAVEVRTYELNMAIDAQTKVLEGAVRTQADLEKDLSKLASDLEGLQRQVEENKKNQESNRKSQEEQKKIIENEKKTLSELQKQLGQVGR